VRGATTVLEMMERFPDGRAIALMRRLGWPCAHCAGRVSEPLSLAAQRHGNPVRPVIECFRALARGGPSAAELGAAARRPRVAQDPLSAWTRSAARHGPAAAVPRRRQR